MPTVPSLSSLPTRDLSAALVTAAETLGARLSGAGGVEVRLALPEEVQAFEAEGAAVCVALRVSGAVAGELALAVALDVHQALGVAAQPADVIAQWQPALVDVVTALGQTLGDVQRAAVRETTAAQALQAAGGSAQHAVVAVDGDQLLALVVLSAEPHIPESRSPESRSPETRPAAAFQPLAATPVDPRRLQLLRDVAMELSVELGRTRMTVRELLSLAPGTIVELDRAAGSPVDLLVNGTLIARGEVVVVDEEYAVRIGEIVGPDTDARAAS